VWRLFRAASRLPCCCPPPSCAGPWRRLASTLQLGRIRDRPQPRCTYTTYASQKFRRKLPACSPCRPSSCSADPHTDQKQCLQRVMPLNVGPKCLHPAMHCNAWHANANLQLTSSNNPSVLWRCLPKVAGRRQPAMCKLSDSGQDVSQAGNAGCTAAARSCLIVSTSSISASTQASATRPQSVHCSHLMHPDA
jgi:hypothetical protein